MSYSIFIKLGLGELKPTSVALQLADRSLTYPRGVVEDVLVKVGKFIFPVDFIVLDMEEDEDDRVPLILGRPFLATAGANIDVKKGELKLQVNDEEVVFSLERVMKWPTDMQECRSIKDVERDAEESVPLILSKDPVENSRSKLLAFLSTDFDDRYDELSNGYIEYLQKSGCRDLARKLKPTAASLKVASAREPPPMKGAKDVVVEVEKRDVDKGRGDDAYLKPPNIPPDTDKFESPFSLSLFCDQFHPDFDLDGDRSDSEIEWKIDRDETRKIEKGDSTDHMVPKKGKVVSVDDKRGRKYWKVKMKEDLPLNQ